MGRPMLGIRFSAAGIRFSAVGFAVLAAGFLAVAVPAYSNANDAVVVGNRSDGTTAAPPSLAECDQPFVSLSPATLPADAITRVQAERTAGVIGVTGPAAIAIPVDLTVGTVANQAPTPATTLRDAHGQPIAGRAAWALVFRGQAVRPPAGPLHGSAAQRRVLMNVLAAFIDAKTGEFLRGWGCTFAP